MAAFLRTCFRRFNRLQEIIIHQNRMDHSTVPIELESFSQYQQLKLKDKFGAWGVTFDSLILRDNSTIWDLFFPFPFDSTIFMSERLAEELFKSNYTGLSIEPTNRIISML